MSRVDMDDAKRRYHAPRRAAQAAETRKRILDAVRARLAPDTWRSTTMAAIAADAGVSVQTVFAVFGSKAGILNALLDDLEETAGSAALAGTLRAASGPHEQLQRVVAFNRRLFEIGADLLDVAEGSRAADAEIAAHVAEGHRRRREAQRPLVASWAAEGALRPGLGDVEAGDLLWAMTSPELFRLLSGAGWTGDRYERHMVDLLTRVLFGTGR
jgi:AcrR family transcriptional regulator